MPYHQSDEATRVRDAAAVLGAINAARTSSGQDPLAEPELPTDASEAVVNQIADLVVAKLQQAQHDQQAQKAQKGEQADSQDAS
jgi:hypothetical protein